MNGVNLTLDMIRRTDEQVIDLLNGVRVKISVESDPDMDAPWENSDGHGPVSDWRHGREKRAGEWALCSDGRSYRFYDARQAMVMAKRDGWGTSAQELADLRQTIGREPTAGDIANAAVRSDFKYLHDWCAGHWEYLSVTVALVGDDGQKMGEDALCGVESCDGHWRECALDMARRLLKANDKEATERAYWEARDCSTVS